MSEDSFDSDHDSIFEDSSDWVDGGGRNFLEFALFSAGTLGTKTDQSMLQLCQHVGLIHAII
jgi:hypothetical protein